MNIAVKKVELIEWLATIQDQALLEKVESLKRQAVSESYEASAKPMSAKQYEEILDRAERDYHQGKHMSQEDIEKESETW